MPRDLYINGPTLVGVKGNVDTIMSELVGFGLSDMPIRVSLNSRHMDVNVDAFGGEVPFEIQYKLTDVNINMTLMHIDKDILDALIQESMGGATTIGALSGAGSRLGNNASRFATGWHYVSLNISSPVEGKPWRFYNAYLTGQPMEIPLGTERSIFILNFRAIPYCQDPYAAGDDAEPGDGAEGYVLWDHTLDGVLS